MLPFPQEANLAKFGLTDWSREVVAGPITFHESPSVHPAVTTLVAGP